jgi:hypothetical protein
MKDKYIDECKQLKQNAEYTAEAHHWIASWNRTLAYIFQIIPAIIAAITSSLVAAGIQSTSWLWATVIASVTAAIASVLDPNKQYQDHLLAAKAFTILKHDARFLHEAKSQTLSDEAFCLAVQNLHDKYNETVRVSPPTSKRFFRIARTVIQSGRHEPDRDANGAIR